MSNALDKEMLHYYRQLTAAEKKAVIQMIKTFIDGRSNNTDRISIEEYNRQIDEAMIQVEKGEFTTLEDLEKEMRSW